ncbi:hypothetical protein JJL45_05940 [Tamlana sp. s12]|uniref:hypothetical protein n=1 Tax=Tamlana sp. s12 TaxID=1630406 RepID=UPI00080026BB|nr:hypothetical protein [Tamlana sp. s12]OBQ55959.1 hypothetical protein VQ01_06120 [Tamlana sp. s12]QQY83535.1 hypothetical protein JJL45_05940 [Tamlana sp. s12]
MNKKVIIIFLIYFIQSIATSCCSCDCDPINTFEKMYNDLDLKAWDTSGFQNTEVLNSAYKNAFGLTISVQFELNQISYSKPIWNISSFGFTSAFAMSDCDCPMDEYITLDPISSIKINVVNLETQEITDVTDNFTTYNYNGEQLTISELFEIREDWMDGFQVDMSEYDNIPDRSLFTVIISLESGAEIVNQTQEITFE